MIKELVKKIASNSITLDQALNESKIISSQIKNNIFKDWIKSELVGYNPDQLLPTYRIWPCEIEAKGIHKYMGEITFPLSFSGEMMDSLDMNTARIKSSVSALENELNDSNTNFLYFPTPQQFVKVVAPFLNSPDVKLISIVQEVPISCIRQLVNSAKHALLDTLLELEQDFPEMEDRFELSNDNVSRIQNIVNNNIYGSQNPIVVAFGENISQSQSVTYSEKNSIPKEIIEKLSALGIPDDSIAELQHIYSENGDKEKKPSVANKIFQWFGNLGTKAIEKGIELNMPLIFEIIHKHLL